MTRTTTLLLLASAALLASPLGAAQQTGSLSVNIPPTDQTFDAGSIHTISATVVFQYDITGMAQPSGIPMSLHVTKAPASAAVTVSPATIIIPTQQLNPSVTQYYKAPFTIVVAVNGSAPHDAFDLIEVTAITHPGTFGNAFLGRASVPVHLHNSGAPCPDAAAPPTAAAPTPSTSAQPVSVQSAAPATPFPIATAAVVGGLAVAGAGVGLLLRRRF